MTTAQTSLFRSLLQATAVLLAMTIALLVAIWLGISRTAAEKVVTALAMPCGLLWYALTLLVIVCVQKRQKQLTVCAALVWLAYFAMGNGFVTARVVRQIEEPFADINPLEQEPFDTVIVLGGGASTGMTSRHQGNGSGDRLILAAQLYHAGLARHLICTGRRITEMTNQEVDPAERSRDVLTRLGVPDDVIESYGGRTTSEEMQDLARRFDKSGQRVGLVTSAWHLRRATRPAERSGLKVTPLPADFMHPPLTDKPLPLAARIESLIPKGDSFAINTRIAKEYLGALVGR